MRDWNARTTALAGACCRHRCKKRDPDATVLDYSAAHMRGMAAVPRTAVGNRHPAAIAEAWGLARLAAPGLITPGEAKGALDGASRIAGKPAGEDAAVLASAFGDRAGGARP